MNATGVGMIAVTVLIISGVLTWQDVLQEKGAWDTMFWMGSLIALAGALAKSGFIKTVSTMAGAAIQSAGMSWLMAFIILILIYVYSHLRLRERFSSHKRNVRGISISIGRCRNSSAFGGNSVRGSLQHYDSADTLWRRCGSDSLWRRFRNSRKVVATRLYHRHRQSCYLARYW